MQLIVLSIFLALVIAGLILLVARPPHGSPVVILPTKTSDGISVYINGAVLKPGVYKLPIGSRIQDAIAMAGGVTPDADYSALNLAATLSDEDFIHVKTIGEVNSSPSTTSQITGDTKGIIVNTQKVDVNHATLDELITLPGIGPVKAQAIITYRSTAGPFTKPDDLLQVDGIGPATLEQILDLIEINP